MHTVTRYCRDILSREKDRRTNFIQPVHITAKYIYRSRPEIGIATADFWSVSNYNKWLAENDSKIILLNYSAAYSSI